MVWTRKPRIKYACVCGRYYNGVRCFCSVVLFALMLWLLLRQCDGVMVCAIAAAVSWLFVVVVDALCVCMCVGIDKWDDGV